MENFIQNIPYIESIETIFFIFLTYAIAGWIMESVGGLFTVKKFVNRGFMIGPYCPVYGVGVVGITLLLNKYTNDLPVLFILSTLICGSLEYATSYFMEKFFNARWWDYHNKKFNINGRICLETLLPFGFVGSAILCYINPFLVNLFNKIPYVVRFYLFVILLVLFIVDFVISLVIISSFKGETYKEKDSTEEISEKVKDKTEELGQMVLDRTESAFMKAESSARGFGRQLRLSELKFGRRVKYTRKSINTVIKSTPQELANKINQSKILFEKKLEDTRNKVIEQSKIKKVQFEEKNKKRKDSIENTIESKINNLRISSKEFTKQVKDNFAKKSLLSSRLMHAFPDMEVKIREKYKNKNEENKEKNK